LAWNVDDGEARAFFWEGLEIRLDKYLNGFVARIGTNPGAPSLAARL
jgi:hypothetical protein